MSPALKDAPPQSVRLADYRPPAFLIDTVELDIHLAGNRTRAIATLALRRNPAAAGEEALHLDGDALVFAGAMLDGRALSAEAFEATPNAFTLFQPPAGPFRLTLETRLDPAANTQLMGLYRSNSCYCTQCEAEGFRRITYFLDRPDVLSVYTTRIEADRAEAPVLLANGNRIEAGETAQGRHFAVWHDPYPKPCYLFAMVAGDLACVTDHFVTRSGRHVTLEIHVEHGKEGRCAYAMDALKRAMAWDEEVFGREYDLDIFMIVAVSDFNMGAMENKGLNVFNDKYVLALPDTATDQDYIHIEAIIAHEYFHNWTGNRITCRDWFQLCLKEGLTVFRDQEFSSDQRSRAVKRIGDVRLLRSQQFAEDAGPLAHPVRPEIYSEINNFYTATVYEKGAEVVRMLKTLIGEDAFRAGMDLYFARHDGQAVTIEDFIACFGQASGRDLKRFMLWYHQSGTPSVRASGHWNPAQRSYRLDLTQSVPPTPGQALKQPMTIPVRLGFVGAGGEVPVSLGGKPFDGLVILEHESHSFLFEGVGEPCVPSLLRGFSAPVKLALDLDEDDLLTLLHHDSDPFNRWQAVQSYASALMTRRVREPALPLDQRFVEAVRSLVRQADADPAFAALTLTLPGEADIARDIGSNVDPDAIFTARQGLRRELALALAGDLAERYRHLAGGGSWSPDAVSAGRRSLRNGLLDLACASGAAEAFALAEQQFADADNMTDRMAALGILTLSGAPQAGAALDAFHARYRSDMLVIDKWLSVQALVPLPATLDKVRALMGHESFAMTNPNRVRALIGTFASGNQTQFNRIDGAGYAFVADRVLELDARNPQVAARLLGAFKSWQALEANRRALAAQQLHRIAGTAGLSRDVADIVHRALG